MVRLAEIKSRIEGYSEDARFAAWMEMYSAEELETKKEIENLIQGKDPLMKILFIRFLARIPEKQACLYLVKLLEDGNKVVFEATKKAFEKNGFDQRWVCLLPLLSSSSQGALFYGIEKLSQAVVIDAIPLMLKMLKLADEKLIAHLLKGLRYFSDERLFPIILPYLQDSREDVRFRAVLVIGALYEAGVREARGPFLQAIKDTSPKIRRAVLWGIKRRPNPKDLELLFEVSANDPDLIVKQEALVCFSFFPTYKVILHLVKILAEGKESLVRLKAEGILYGFFPEVLFDALWKVASRQSGKIRNKALIILAEIRVQSKKYFDFLSRTLKKAKDPKEQLPILEAFGVVEDPRAIKELEPRLKGNQLLAYTAMGSLLKIWAHYPEKVPIADYLQDPDLAPLFKQTILKQMLKLGKWEYYAKTMRAVLLGLLKHENLNIRYLSAQVLAPVTSKQVLEECFASVLSEMDPAYAQFLKESIRRHLTEKPEWMGHLVQSYKNNSKAVHILFDIVKEADILGEKLLALLFSVLEPPLSLHQSSFQDSLKEIIVHFLVQHKLAFDAFLKRLEKISGRDALLVLCADALKENPEIAAKIPVPLLENWFAEESSQGKEAIIDLFSMAKEERSVRFLVTLLCDEKMIPFQEKASKGLQQLMGAA